MKKPELIKKLQDIEWQDFEVKEAKTAVPKNSWETVSAFCNTAGGWLICLCIRIIFLTPSPVYGFFPTE